MIYLNRGVSNTIITRFFDRRSDINSFFIWEVTNDFSGDIYRFLLEDISPNSCSYNMFKIIHSEDELENINNLGVEIIDGDEYLYLPSGHNYYTIYETLEPILDEMAVIGIIEKDILFVELDRDSEMSNSGSDIYF